MLKLLGKWCGRAMALLVAIGATTAWAVPSVTDLVLVSEKRITRTVYQYTYKLTLQNDATALTDVVALAQSAGPGTTIVDNDATLPSLAANAAQTTADTIVLRHDRLQPFRKDLIVWSVTGTPVRAGIILSGDPAATVQTAMPDYDAGHVVPESEISIDAATGARVIRTALYVVFRRDASVADANAALSSIDGRILASLQGNNVVSVGIPDPGSLAALEIIMQGLRASPMVEIVLKDSLPETDALPSDPYYNNTMQRLDHHLAVRGAAAWNAYKGYENAKGKPSLLIYDYFGDGAPAIESGVVWSDPASFNSNSLNSHGYHVTGIISGNFGGTGEIGEVTGVVPTRGTEPGFNSALRGDVLDATRIVEAASESLPFFATSSWVRLAKKLHSTSDNVVVNSSIYWPVMKCDANVDENMAKEYALLWINLIRRGENLATPSALEKRVFHATSAGNRNNQCNSASNLQIAKFNSPPAAAGLLSQQVLGVPPLANTLAVENRAVLPPLSSSGKTQPFCTHVSSYLEGNISAIGSRADLLNTGIWSFLDAASIAGNTSPISGGPMAGTSMATPQVAGLAAYLWSLNPTFSGAEVAATIKNHARPTTACGGSEISSTPVIDAYATILSADRDFEDAPARKAILDVNEDGVFDSADTLLFLEKMYLEPTSGTVADYSRYDLNGDSFTGGSGTEWVNLDMSYDVSNMSSTYGLITAADNGTPMSIDEKAVTDHQMLCYYVNSRMFPQDQLGNVSAQLIAVRQQTGRTDIPDCEAVKLVSKLNDTGITFCDLYGNTDPRSNSCNDAYPPGQDGEYGRDALAKAGLLHKVGGGNAGFDFTALDAAGQPTTPSSGPNPHSCVRDNVTGLVWEVKTDDGGLRDRDWTYSWYSTDANNGGHPGYPDYGDNCADSNRCDTEKYVADVNAVGLCGYSDWRLPTRAELQSIVDYGGYSPAIDTTHFPDTRGSVFWSSSPSFYFPDGAWLVDFYNGQVDFTIRSASYPVRLVRGGQ